MVGRNACPRAAEDAVQRQTGRLAERIPERAVKRRDADHRHALVAEEVDVVPCPGPEFGNVSRIPADEQLTQFRDHLHQHLGAAIVEGKDQVFAGDAGIAAHAQQDAAEPADLAERAADRLLERQRYRCRVDAGDLHEYPPASMRVRSPFR
jgi:hypothetical protein